MPTRLPPWKTRAGVISRLVELIGRVSPDGNENSIITTRDIESALMYMVVGDWSIAYYACCGFWAKKRREPRSLGVKYNSAKVFDIGQCQFESRARAFLCFCESSERLRELFTYNSSYMQPKVDDDNNNCHSFPGVKFTVDTSPVSVQNFAGANLHFQPKYQDHVVKLCITITMTGYIFWSRRTRLIHRSRPRSALPRLSRWTHGAGHLSPLLRGKNLLRWWNPPGDRFPLSSARRCSTQEAFPGRALPSRRPNPYPA
jgi:hypothetical protein